MKKLLITFAAIAISTSASAWGPREQGALLGLAIGAGAMALSQQSQTQPIPQSPTIVYPQQQICGYNVYCGEPQRTYVPTCRIEQQVDYYGRVIATYQVCR